MNSSLLELAKKFIIERHRYRLWIKVVTSLAMVVVFVTTYMLVLPAITIEKQAVCGLEEHTHGVDCYEDTEVLICGLEEDEEHTHDESCYDVITEFVCNTEEHTHTAECFEEDDDSAESDLSSDDLDYENVGEIGDLTASAEPDNEAVDNKSLDSVIPEESTSPEESEVPELSAAPEESAIPELSVTPEESIGSAVTSETGSNSGISNTTIIGGSDESNKVTASEVPVESIEPIKSEKPVEDSEPAASEVPAKASEPSSSEAPSEAFEPSSSEAPSEASEPSSSEAPTKASEPAASEIPSETSGPTDNNELTEADIANVNASGDEGFICGLKEHTHDAACYDENGELICGLEEHTHWAACYGISLMMIDDIVFKIDSLDYTLTLNADLSYTLTISGSTDGEAIIPEDVMSSDELAKYKSTISNVIIDIDAQAYTIGSGAFKNCTSLKEVEFRRHDLPLVIYDSAFSGCTRLEKINLEDTKLSQILAKATGSSVSDGAFYGTALTEITLPSSLYNIGNYTFYGCTKLKSVNFMNSGSDLYTFYMGFSAFQQCSSLETINLDAIGASLIKISGTIDSGITQGLFKDCTSLKSITIPSNFCINDTVGSEGLFRNCTSLENVIFEPNSNIMYLSGYVFAGCTSLHELDLTPLTNLSTISDYTIRDSSIETIKLPAGIDVLTKYALAYDTALKNVEFAENCKLRTMDYAFCNDTALQTMDLSQLENLNILGTNSFSNCYVLEKISLPENLTGISSNTFINCTNLKTINYNAVNLADVGSNIFSNISSNFVLNIGKNVDTIPAAFFTQASGHMGSIVFEGENTFTVSAEAGTGLQAPLDVLNGNYYVSAGGDLYKINSDGTLNLAYKTNTGGIYTIPSSVGGYTVAGIDRYAFKNSAAVSISFENVNSIKNVSDYAFADCASLSEIEGLTAVDDVKKMFEENGVNADDSAFYNTALKGASEYIDTSEETFSGTKLSTGDIIIYNDEFKISNSVGEYLTGQKDTINISVSEAGNDSIFRLYFQCGDDCSYITNISQVQNYPVSYHSVEGTNIHYYEIGPCASGETINMDFAEFSYPNLSADGSKIRVWAVRGTSDIFDEIGETAVMPIDENSAPEILEEYPGLAVSTEYFEIVWNTRAYSHPVNESINTVPAFNITSDDKVALANLQYWVRLEDNTDVKEGISASDTNAGKLGSSNLYGSDYVTYVDLEDKLILPEGLEWREGTIDALKNGNYRYEFDTVASSKVGRVYVEINGAEYMLFQAKANFNRYNLLSVGVYVNEDDNIIITWQGKNTSEKLEIANMGTDFLFGPEILIYNEEKYKAANPNSTNITFHLANYVSSVEHYHYAEPAKTEKLLEDNKTISSNATLVLKKTIDNADKMHGTVDEPYFYFGEDIKYTITAENSSAFNYTNLAYLSDPLNNYQYLKPENMQAIFDEAAADGTYTVRINISNAAIAQTPAGEEVTAINGKDTALTSVQNSGVVQDYENRHYTSDGDLAVKNAVLSLYKDDNGILTLTANYNENVQRTVTIGDGRDFPDIESALEDIGFVIIFNTVYTVDYLYPSGFPLGTKKEYTINANFKDSLMLLSADNEEYYGFPTIGGMGNYEIAGLQNIVKACNSSGGQLTSATASYVNSDNKTINTVTIKPEINISKSIVVNNNTYGEGSAEVEFKDESVIGYKVNVQHRGSGSYKLLPIVDVLSGIQAILAPVSDNDDAEWANYADIYISDGVKYYILKPTGDDTEYTFKGVWLGTYYADSVTVSLDMVENDGVTSVQSVNSIIKWYIKDSVENTFIANAEYKVIADRELLGYDVNELSYRIANTAYVNDRESHRLWDSRGGINTVIIFDKKIVTEENKVNPNFDKLDDDGFTRISQNSTTVTYRLEFYSNNADEKTIDGSYFYDVLPKHTIAEDGYSFAWEKGVNISIRYASTEGTYASYNGASIDESNGDEWYLTGTDPSTGNMDATQRQQYLKWNSLFKITFAPQGRFYIYVTLEFPGGDDEEVWKQYIQAHGTDTLINTLYMYNYPKSVTHELSDPGKAFIQKGVYETGYYTYTNATLPATYFRGGDRYTYTNTTNTVLGNAVVTYYVVLKNSSDVRLYLTPIYDELPKGFTFYSLRNNTEGGNNSTSANDGFNSYSGVGNVYNVKDETGVSDGVRSPLAVAGTNVDSAKSDSLRLKDPVRVTKTGDTIVNGHHILKFELSGGVLENQQENGMYYLDPGQWVTFGYECLTGVSSVSENIADNAVAMELIDTGQNMAVDNDTAVTTASSWNTAPFNDGTRELWDNSTALQHGFSTGDNDSQWLASNVTVYRGNEVIPGITKTVKDSVTGEQVLNTNIDKLGIAEWTVTAYNDGSGPIHNYTIEDTIESPHHFVGTVSYGIYTNDTLGRTKTGNTDIKLAYAEPLFTIADRDYNNETSVTIRTNSNQAVEIPLDGTQKLCYFSLKHEGLTSNNIPAYVSIDRDDEAGTETMKIQFTMDICDIVPNGYAKIELQTQNITGVYNSLPAVYNISSLVPYDKSYNAGSVSKGDNIKDADGNNYGVSNMAFISTDIAFPTTSLNKISSTVNVDGEDIVNTASSNESKKSILVDDTAQPFTYTLTVNNAKDKAMNKLVLIDNLPQTGDTNTLSDKISRGSEFKVNLSSAPNFKVTIISEDGSSVTVLDPSLYTIQYSSKTGSFSDDDWKGENDSEWITWTGNETDEIISNIRSIRLIIDDGTVVAADGSIVTEGNSSKSIPMGATVQLTFDAVIDGNAEGEDIAEAGETAWNTFGYQYLIAAIDENTGDMKANYLFATPLKVGLSMPTEPYLSKSLVNGSGVSVSSSRDESFEFVIYSGDKIDFDDYTQSCIGNAVSGRDFTYIDLTVNAGETISDTLQLSGLKKYSYSGDEFIALDDDWEWEFSYDSDGNIVYQSYNIVEIENDDSAYKYTPTNIINSRNYTFEYNPSGELTLKYVNARDNWKINLFKQDGNGESLAGAVFGLYSPNISDALTGSEDNSNLTALQEMYGLTDDIETSIEHDGDTYYLYKAAVTSDMGLIEWNSLSADAYIIKELKAPDGYYIDTTAQDYSEYFTVSYDPDEREKYLTVTNYAGSELPSTGGSGLGRLIELAGGLIMAAAAVYYGWIYFRKKRG